MSASCNNFETRYRSLSPYDVKNTIEKMAEKRSLVAAVLIGTAASDIFTQDIEDLPQLIINDGASDNKAEKPEPQKAPSAAESPEPDTVQYAKDNQVAYIKTQIKKKDIPEKDFFAEWKEYFESWDDIPANIVNDILEWIRDQ